jgi:hypothetical protein
MTKELYFDDYDNEVSNQEVEGQELVESKQIAEAINYSLSFFEVPIISNIGKHCGASTIENFSSGVVYTLYGDFTLQLLPRASILESISLVAINTLTLDKFLIERLLIAPNQNLTNLIQRIVLESNKL